MATCPYQCEWWTRFLVGCVQLLICITLYQTHKVVVHFSWCNCCEFGLVVFVFWTVMEALYICIHVQCMYTIIPPQAWSVCFSLLKFPTHSLSLRIWWGHSTSGHGRITPSYMYMRNGYLGYFRSKRVLSKENFGVLPIRGDAHPQKREKWHSWPLSLSSALPTAPALIISLIFVGRGSGFRVAILVQTTIVECKNEMK